MPHRALLVAFTLFLGVDYEVGYCGYSAQHIFIFESSAVCVLLIIVVYFLLNHRVYRNHQRAGHFQGTEGLS